MGFERVETAGVRRMAEYRAFTIGSDGHFVGFEPTVCDDDTAAIERAKRLLDGRDIEVWCAARLITRLTAQKTSAVTHEIKDGFEAQAVRGHLSWPPQALQSAQTPARIQNLLTGIPSLKTYARSARAAPRVFHLAKCS